MKGSFKYFFVFLMGCFCVNSAFAAASAQKNAKHTQQAAYKTVCNYQKKCTKSSKTGKTYCKKVKVCNKVKKT